MRFEWSGGRLPQLGDVAAQTSYEGAADADLIRRAYLVVGVEEGRSRDRFHLIMERVEYGTLPDSLDPAAMWGFYNLPRR